MRAIALRVSFVLSMLAAPDAPAAEVVASAPENYLEPLVLEVKFKEGQAIRLRQGQPADTGFARQGLRSAKASGALEAVRSRGGQWLRSHAAVPEQELERMRAGAARRGRAVPDLNLYFRVIMTNAADRALVEETLASLAEVEAVYRVPKPLPPPVVYDFSNPANPSGEWQRYLDAAPTGVDARYAWSNGVTAAGIKVCDIEYGWNATHVDLPAIIRLGPAPSPTEWVDHGTAVLGVMAGRHDTNGVRGIAYGAGFRFASPLSDAYGGYNLGAAISAALTNLVEGDVLLIEQQGVGPVGEYVPVSWSKPTYDTIVNAVANGVIVVEAAGNGSQNLDDPIYSTGNGGHWPFLPANDSGSILVGAGAPPQYPSPRSRIDFSNYGSTLDLQGYGYLVLSCGYGDLNNAGGSNQHFTAVFSGTSSASPIVAGAAAVLQQAWIQHHTNPASPAIIRAILRATGTPQQGDGTIGPLPNLRSALMAVTNQVDSDSDGVIDLLDNCPALPNAGQADQDTDGVGDECDNCPTVSNSSQANQDGDGLGDACDPDRDGDGVDNAVDNCPDRTNGGQADADNDGLGDACDACNRLQPVYQPAVAPQIITLLSGGTPNTAGENFDLNTNARPVGARFQCGFGDFGQLYINHDATNFYIGAQGVDMAGDNNVMILFLGFNTLTDNKQNLWENTGKPNALDYLHNLAFSVPMDLALVLGHEYGDGNFTDFNFGSINFGQGGFYLSAFDFFPVGGIRMTQYDGTGTVAITSSNDDPDFRTERWETSIPWTSLNAPQGMASVTQLFICGVFASDGLQNGVDRYLSGNYLGAGATSSSGLDTNTQNYAFGFVTLTPFTIDLSDIDADHLADAFEREHYGALTNGPASDTDGDGVSLMDEYVANTQPTNRLHFPRLEIGIGQSSNPWKIYFPTSTGRLYRVDVSTNLAPPDWQPLATNLPGSGAVQELSDTNAAGVRYFRHAVELAP